MARIQANSLALTATTKMISRLNVNLPKARAKQAAGKPLTQKEQYVLDHTQRIRALVKVTALDTVPIELSDFIKNEC